MSEYQLEIKQIVDYPRCRIYRQFIQSLIKDQSIRASGGCGLFHYTVLCSYANFRTSYRRLGGVNYTIFPGEWLCRFQELSEVLRVRNKKQTAAILQDLQERHLITFDILCDGEIVKYKIKGWHKHNKVLEYNAPCQKDTGFFFIPVCVASEIVGTRRPSEMDIALDLWLNTVYYDEQVEGSMIGPVVYMRNGTGNPLVSYEYLGRRWNMSKATVGRYLKKYEALGYLSLTTFPGTHGSVIYLQKYLSTMFRIADVLLDKEEIAMALKIKLELDDSVSNGDITVSKSNEERMMNQIRKVLVPQGLSCLECKKMKYKLLRLSACSGDVNLLGATYRLLIYCGEDTKTAAFDLKIKQVGRKETVNEKRNN